MSSKKDVYTSHHNTFMTTMANLNDSKNVGVNSPRNIYFQSRHPAMSSTISPPPQRQLVDLDTMIGLGGINHGNEVTARMYGQSYGVSDVYPKPYIGFNNHSFLSNPFLSNNNTLNGNSSEVNMDINENGFYSGMMANQAQRQLSSSPRQGYTKQNGCLLNTQSDIMQSNNTQQNMFQQNYMERQQQQQTQQQNQSQTQHVQFYQNQQLLQQENLYQQQEFQQVQQPNIQGPQSNHGEQLWQQHQLQQAQSNQNHNQFHQQQQQQVLLQNGLSKYDKYTQNQHLQQQQQKIDLNQLHQHKQQQMLQQKQFSTNQKEEQRMQLPEDPEQLDNKMDTSSSTLLDQLTDIVREMDTFGGYFNETHLQDIDQEASNLFSEAIQSFISQEDNNNNENKHLPDITDHDISSGLADEFNADLQQLEFPENVDNIKMEGAECTIPEEKKSRSSSLEANMQQEEEELPNEIFNSEGETFLHLAIHSKDMAQCLEILDTPVLGRAINAKNASNEVPLLILLAKCLDNCTDVLKKLFLLDVNINVTDNTGNNMFHICAIEAMSEDQCLNVLRVCFEQENYAEQYKRIINNRNIRGMTPSHMATKKSFRRVLRMLYEHGADLDLTEFQDKKTCIVIAAEANDWITVTELIEMKADVNKETKACQRAINFAIKTGREDMIKLLFENGTTVHKWKDMVPSQEIEKLVKKLNTKMRRKKKKI